MGGRHSQPGSSEKERHAELRKKVSTTLQKSREKHLSDALSSSEPRLVTVGVDSGEGSEGKEKKRSEAESGFVPLSPGSPDDLNLRDSVFMRDSETAPGDSSSSSDSSDSEVEEQMSNSAQASLLMRERKSKQKCEKPSWKKKSFHPLGRYDRSSSFYDEVDRKAAKEDPQKYTFFFENLVFEGGGNKGLAYCGAVRYLEELGVMQRVKRFAGASAGGMVAGLLAVGYNSYDIEQFLSDRIDKVFLDASCGYLSLLPNILHSFGWNPGNKIYDWFGDKMKEKTGDADFTFMQLYKKKGTVLSITVTNLNLMTTEYCHPKTTPDMPIRLALRMSMAIPGLFSAMRYKRLCQEDVYVDGGVLCNYPVHCFDGWYLSMDPKDSFLRKLQPLREIPRLMERKNRFKTFNEKTLGMLLYSDGEDDMLRSNLETRVGCLEPAKPEPETKLYKEREKEARQKQRAEREYAAVVHAVDSFLRVLKKHNMDDNDVINRQELEAAFRDEEEFPRREAEVLFGKDCTVAQAFEKLDTDGNGQIHYDELVRFIEETGVSIQNRFLGYQRREINSFVSFLNTLTSTLTFNVQRLYVQDEDKRRTVGINTGHVHTTDFVLEEPDREFVVQRGYNSMKSFLKYYVVNHREKVVLRSQDKAIFPDIAENHATDPTSSPAHTYSHPDRITATPVED